MVGWNEKAWTQGDFNSVSEGIETDDICWTGKLDVEHPGDPRRSDPKVVAALDTAARIVAFRLHKRGLPATWVRGAKLLQDTGRGFTRHVDGGAIAGGHACPVALGDTVRWQYFVSLVKRELKRGDFRKEWGRD